MKKLNLMDIIVICIFIFAIGLGLLTYKSFRQTAGKQILSTKPIVFQVYLRSVTLTTDGVNPIQAGDETFITIRNVPYTNLQVMDSKLDTKKTVISINSTPVVVDDYSQYAVYDIVVTLKDNAQITKDGPVVGGNKIKMGLPITLEGQNYKFNGVVSNIELTDNAINE